MMGEYIQLGEVKTWYDEHGAGSPLVLLHGGLVDARWFEPNLAPLAERFHVYTPERRGHGHTPDVPGPITYQLMADETIAFLDTVVGEAADLVGHSDGAFVAMLVAMQRPELVNRLVMISGGFNKSGEAMPDMEWNVDQIAEFLAPAYGEVSPDGIDHFKEVATKIGEMAAVEPTLQASELAKVTQRALVMFSDDDLDEQILITREFDAPRHLVYEAWTTPELVKRWWNAKRGEVTVAEIDLRVGGTWRYVMVTDDRIEVAFHGEYRELVPNERIVSTEVYEGMPAGAPEAGTLNTATFIEADGRTTLTILVQAPSKELRDAIIDSGMEAGMQDAMDLLEQVAGSLR